jgi:hypothetical protein
VSGIKILLYRTKSATSEITFLKICENIHVPDLMSKFPSTFNNNIQIQNICKCTSCTFYVHWSSFTSAHLDIFVAVCRLFIMTLSTSFIHYQKSCSLSDFGYCYTSLTNTNIMLFTQSIDYEALNQFISMNSLSTHLTHDLVLTHRCAFYHSLSYSTGCFPQKCHRSNGGFCAHGTNYFSAS